MERQNIVIILLLLMIIEEIRCCYITNCPPGGKRATGAHNARIRECMRCGTDGQGHCFGPDICCGPTIGCHIRNHESAICRAEDFHPVRCMNRGSLCGIDNTGHCAAVGVCCSPDGCFLDKSCEPSEVVTYSKGE